MSIYLKIYEDVLQDINNGILKQGQRLPSLYDMSKKYACSKGTVIKAYERLCQNHIIFSKPHSGFYVADNLIRNFDTQNQKYNLSTGNTPVDSLSIIDIKHCLNIAAELYAKNSIDLSLRGTLSLNKYLVHYLEHEGIYTQEDNIHLIQGITPTLSMLSLCTFPNNKEIILIEEPSFWNYIKFLKDNSLPVMTITRDENGINLKLLEHYFKNFSIKFFYTIPRNHNPLGTVLSYKQRKKIMELAIKYDVYIIEDDYFAECYQIPKYVPIHYFSYQKNCIYLRSSSKEFPFIRIGIAIVPDTLHRIFLDMSETFYYYSYHMPSLISQATYESYLKSKLVMKQENIIEKRIKEKLAIVHKETKSWNPHIIKLIGAKCGYYFSLKIHKDIDISQLVSALEQKNIFVISNLKAYYNENNFDNSIRLSIAQIYPQNLKEALNMIYSYVLESLQS